MKPASWFALLLGTLLIGFGWVGNSVRGDEHSVSIFPWFVTLLAFPLAIYPGLRLQAQTGQATVAELRRAGWSIVWPAAVLFACFNTAFGAATFAHPAAILLVFAFGGTLVATIILGMLCAQLCALVITSSFSQSRAT
jgi:hypothetical protein